jgi:hypothetical protein
MEARLIATETEPQEVRYTLEIRSASNRSGAGNQLVLYAQGGLAQVEENSSQVYSPLVVRQAHLQIHSSDAETVRLDAKIQLQTLIDEILDEYFSWASEIQFETFTN